jgi:hypothetical protein
MSLLAAQAQPLLAKLKSSGVYLNEGGSAGALQQIDVVA